MDKYLLQILLDVNTIIIPGLGALTVTNAKTGEMMFMSYLKYDDGKLSAYISEKEGMSENDAKNLIAKYVREIQAKLDKGDSYDMFQFGRFLKNKNGDIDFESWGTYASAETASRENESTEFSIDNQIIEEVSEVDPVITEILPVTPEYLETIEAIDVPAAEELTPEENPEVVAKPAISEEDQSHTEEVTVPEFSETAQTEDNNTDDDDIFDDLTVMPTPVSTASLDEILEKSEAPDPIEVQEPQAEKNQDSSAEIPKPDLIANQTQDESRVQVENIYIPPAETTPEPVAKPSPDLAKKKEKIVVEPKPKKKRGAGFWILVILIILVIGGGTATLLFYDQVKSYLPFLESKRVEAEQKKDTAVSAEEMNKNAAALEAAENERISSENQPGTEEIAPFETQAEEVEQPSIPEPIAVSNDGSKPYHVIGGAFASKENADRYAAKNSGNVIGQYGGMHLVSLGSYASKQEANSAINGKAWIFKKP